MKMMKKLLLFLVLLSLFISIGLVVKDGNQGAFFDQEILDRIHNDQNPKVFSFMKAVSFLGSEIFLFPAVGLFILINLINKNYFLSKLLLFNSLGSFILNNILKLVYNRTRPIGYMLVEQGGLSYPSGHSMVTMSMYLAFAYLINRKIWSKSKRTGIYILALLLIFLMGTSRLYLGVHWPTDVVGGFAMGYLVFDMSTWLIKDKQFKM